MFIDFREKKGERHTETSMWERNIDWLPPIHVPTGDWTGDQKCNLGICPEQESNPKPFGIWDNLQITELPARVEYIQNIYYILTVQSATENKMLLRKS